MKHISKFFKKYHDFEIVIKFSDLEKLIKKNEKKTTKSIQSKCEKV